MRCQIDSMKQVSQNSGRLRLLLQYGRQQSSVSCRADEALNCGEAGYSPANDQNHLDLCHISRLFVAPARWRRLTASTDLVSLLEREHMPYEEDGPLDDL
jgi:hypothetical protein